MEGLGDVVVNGGGEGDATVATTAEDGEVGLAKHDDKVAGGDSQVVGAGGDIGAL